MNPVQAFVCFASYLVLVTWLAGLSMKVDRLEKEIKELQSKKSVDGDPG